MHLDFFVRQSLARMPGKNATCFLLLPPMLKDEAVLPPEVIELPEHQPHGGGVLMYLFCFVPDEDEAQAHHTGHCIFLV